METDSKINNGMWYKYHKVVIITDGADLSKHYQVFVRNKWWKRWELYYETSGRVQFENNYLTFIQ